MANLQIAVNDTYFRARAVDHGKLAREFFESLAANVFGQAYVYWETYHKFAGRREIPLLHSERKLYSTFSSAINAITPVHLSEWPFALPDWADGDMRVVDFWCMSRPRETGKALNYFLEVKKGYYCVSNGTDEGLRGDATKKINEAIEQISLLKKIKPNWSGHGDVFMAVPVIHGYHSNSRTATFDEEQVVDSIYSMIDRRLGAQLIASTWTLPDDMDTQWHSKCAFVTIAGIVLTKKR